VQQALVSTDRELWRETPDDAYSPSIHVTAAGGIGINVGGTVVVRTVREWHGLVVQPPDLASQIRRLKAAITELVEIGKGPGDWEIKYDLVFNRSRETIYPVLDALGLKLDYLDPDTTYEEDTRAYLAAINDLWSRLP
jgi:hypothetical protein